MIDHFLADCEPLTPGDAAAAIIHLDDGRYALQLRDDKPGVFYPGHWGLFGGGVESGETAEQALQRELVEELGLSTTALRRIFRFQFDMRPIGLANIYREFFEVVLPAAAVPNMHLGEGTKLGLFTGSEVLRLAPVVPYDAFALWLWLNSTRLGTDAAMQRAVDADTGAGCRRP